MMTSPRIVTSPGGVAIAAYESGDASRPTVVAVHGYPDSHTVWDGVAEQLAKRYHVVTYDVRGCGASGKPDRRSAYRLDHLVDDFRAVIDAVSPGEPVHVLAHDWGSIQAWAAVTAQPLAGRINSFTSISGPSLDYAGAWLRTARKHPVASARQLAHSYYIALFQLPGLPEFAARHGLLDALVDRAGGSTHRGAAPARTEADKVNGLSLYRANMIGRLVRPRPVATSVPVQVIVPGSDPFVTRDLAVDAARPWVEHLTVQTAAGGHWIVSERPHVVAAMATEFLDSLATARPPQPIPAGRGRGSR